MLFIRIKNAPTKGDEYVIYYETYPVGNDVTNSIAPYED